MKIFSLSATTCGLVALVTAASVFATIRVQHQFLLLPWAGGAVAIGATLLGSWLLSRQVRLEIATIERLLAGEDAGQHRRVGIIEFERLTQTIQQATRKWEAVAAESRRQAKEFSTMVQLLDRRSSANQPDCNHLRSVLAGLGTSLANQLGQCSRALNESQQHVSGLLQQSESQSNTLVKANAVIDQLAASIESLDHPRLDRSDKENPFALLHSIQDSVDSVVAELGKIGSDSQRCERKLSGLHDPTKEISSIVQSISDLAARTDLLALNASIESIRAGEHGKGFALVAEEVRRMAEQIASATRELSNALDAIQLVIAESSRVVAENYQQLDTQTEQSRAVQQKVVDAIAAWQREQGSLQRITSATQAQQRLMTDISNLFEQLAEASRSTRLHGSSIQQSAGGLTQAVSQAVSIAQHLGVNHGSIELRRDSSDETHDPVAAETSVDASSAPRGPR